MKLKECGLHAKVGRYIIIILERGVWHPHKSAKSIPKLFSVSPLMHQRQSIAGLPSVSFYPYLLILLNQEIFLSLGKKKDHLISFIYAFVCKSEESSCSEFHFHATAFEGFCIALQFSTEWTIPTGSTSLGLNKDKMRSIINLQ